MKSGIGQSELLHAALKKVGIDSTFFVVEGAGRGFKNRPDLDPIIERMFRETLETRRNQQVKAPNSKG